MKNLGRIILGVLFLAAIVSFMVTYRVEFYERGVLTTFGRASEDGRAQGPGLHVKWPYPFQSVTKYDTRIQFVDTRAETQQTADSKQIIVEAFCLWRVSDPLAFFRRFSNAGDRAEEHFREAEVILRDTLRSALSATGRYTLADLYPAGGGVSKLPELERSVLSAMTHGDAADGGATPEGVGVGLRAYGIEVVHAGISRVLLPQETSKAVIERMRENRNRLVAEIESAGEAEAQAIKTKAENQAKTIRSFAQRRAREIEALGDIEAAPYIASMSSNPSFAVFLKNLEMLSQILPSKATLVVESRFPGLEVLDPSSMTGLEDGQLPIDATVEALAGDVARTDDRATADAEVSDGR